MMGEATSLIELANNLGSVTMTLCACFWYIKYLTDTHKAREEMWIAKDTESDIRLAESHAKLAELQRDSHTQLLTVLSNVNTTLQEMTVAISRLEQKMEK